MIVYMKLTAPEDALSIIIMIGKDRRFNFDRFMTKFQEKRHHSETESEYTERLDDIKKSKRNITEVTKDVYGEKHMHNLQKIIEIPVNIWNDEEYSQEKIYKDELLPERVIYEPHLIKEFIDNYEMQHIDYGWVETGRAEFFAKLSTDNHDVSKRSLWLDYGVCLYEISKRQQFDISVLEKWRKDRLERENEEKNDEQTYIDKHKNPEYIHREDEENTSAIVSGPMKRSRGGMAYAYPVQIMLVTKTKPPLAPRGIKSSF